MDVESGIDGVIREKGMEALTELLDLICKTAVSIDLSRSRVEAEDFRPKSLIVVGSVAGEGHPEMLRDGFSIARDTAALEFIWQATAVSKILEVVQERQQVKVVTVEPRGVRISGARYG